MAVIPEGNFISTYTNATWTELASPSSGEVLVLRNLLICNTTSSNKTIGVRITQSDGSTVESVIIASYIIEANDTLLFGPADIFLCLSNQQQLQVKADDAGVNFSAFGGGE
jgi:hypothetical protein